MESIHAYINECRKSSATYSVQTTLNELNGKKANNKSLDSFFDSVMNIDISMQHCKDHFSPNNNHNSPISRIKK